MWTHTWQTCVFFSNLEWSLHPPPTEGSVRANAPHTHAVTPFSFLLWALTPPAHCTRFSMSLGSQPPVLHHLPSHLTSLCPYFSLGLRGPLPLIRIPLTPAQTLAHSPASHRPQRTDITRPSGRGCTEGQTRGNGGFRMCNCIKQMFMEESWVFKKTRKYVSCHMR